MLHHLSKRYFTLFGFLLFWILINHLLKSWFQFVSLKLYSHNFHFLFFIIHYFFIIIIFLNLPETKKKKYSNEEAIYKIGRRVILKSHKITKRLPNWHSKTFYSIIGDRSVTQTIDLLVTNTYSMLVEKFLLLAMETYEFISKLMCFPNNFIRTQYF